MVVASAKGSYKVKDIVDSMRQLYGNRADAPVASPSFSASSFNTVKKVKQFCTYCKRKNHTVADCWKKRKDSGQKQMKENTDDAVGPCKNTYFTYLSDQSEQFQRSGLIDLGTVHTVVGKSTLDGIMKFYNITRIEKCPPLSLAHRFGNYREPMEPEFGAIIPWTARDNKGKDHCFNLRADVLDGEHPLLIGCPTLIAMEASLDFKTLELKAVINGSFCMLNLNRQGNHIFIDHAPLERINTSQVVSQGSEDANSYYGSTIHNISQFFRQPDLC
jgi:hypothetical protein